MIDLMVIIDKRKGGMKIKEGMLGDLLISQSLDFITKLLGLADEESGKKKIDYKIFAKEKWTADEYDLIGDYAKRDIEVTKKLYEWLEDYFEASKEFVTEESIRKKKYLTSSLAGFAYEAICKAMSWKPEMSKSEEKVTLKGGYVSYPAGDKFEGDIFCLDFNSLYPHITIQCNLFGRVKGLETDGRPTWYGNNKWKLDGTYYADELSPICELFKKWYQDRLEYKKQKDKREYSLKIILNTGSYGILNTPYYPKVFDKIAGRDCPGVGRQWILYSRKCFRDAGFNVVYSDTDSDYIVLKEGQTKEDMLKVKDKIINDIKASVPFPQDTFDMGIDDEIKYMFFFKRKDKVSDEKDEIMDDDDFINKPLGLLKKNYIYVTKDDRVVIKNLGIMKKSTSKLTRKLFWDYLVPQIKKGKIKFSKVYLQNKINELLEKDYTLAVLRKSVGNIKEYSKSPTGLQAQIANRYGSGIHFLIPNTKGLGVGKGKRYCTVEEYKENNLRIEHIDLSNVWKELDYFIAPQVMKNIFEF